MMIIMQQDTAADVLLAEFAFRTVGVVVAHPDDETLWAGGTLLMHPAWRSSIYTLCRASDADRAPKYYRTLTEYAASGRMADLDDGVAQSPLPASLVEHTIADLLAGNSFDLLMTHGPRGEYTRHQRHVDVHKAITALWESGRIALKELWCFAYTDDNKAHYPRAIADAPLQQMLSQTVWEHKYRIIHEIYGFSAESWEARTTPVREAFWRFTNPEDLAEWLAGKEAYR